MLISFNISTIIMTMVSLTREDPTMMRNGCLTLCQFNIPQDVLFDYERLVVMMMMMMMVMTIMMNWWGWEGGGCNYENPSSGSDSAPHCIRAHQRRKQLHSGFCNKDKRTTRFILPLSLLSENDQIICSAQASSSSIVSPARLVAVCCDCWCPM